MKSLVLPVFTAFTVMFVLYSHFTGYNDGLLTNILRWGEITVVFFLLAGIVRYIVKQTAKVRTGVKPIYPAIVTASFFITVFAGFFNFAGERFAWENLIRDHPEHLYDVSLSVIESDPYFRHHPSKNKLALIVANRVNSGFVPSEEILARSDISFSGFKTLISNQGMAPGDSVILNEDDMRLIEPLSARTASVSREIVAIMLPLAGDIRDWLSSVLILFDDSGFVADTTVLKDLVLNGVAVEGSTDILEKIMLEDPAKPHSSVISQKDMAYAISDTVFHRFAGNMSQASFRTAVHSFLKTGASHHTPVRGILRWIYRTFFDPLYATLMAIVMLTMLLAIFNVLNFRSYSYGVITVSALFVMAGFLPYSCSYFPQEWSGPFIDGWIMNVPSLAALRGVLLGTGSGVIYLYFRRTFSFINDMSGKAK